MASLKSMHVFLPLLIAYSLSLHGVAAHRKLNLNKHPIKRHVLMSSSNPTFYSAFDTNANHNNFNHAVDKDSRNFNYQDSANGFNGEFTTKSYTNSYGTDANLPLTTANTHQANTNSYGTDANLPLTTANTRQANGGQFSNPTTTITHQANGMLYSNPTNGVQYSNPTSYAFSSPSSSSTPSLYGGNFPHSFEASFPGSRTGYGKQSFPSSDQQGLQYTYPSDAGRSSFFYKSPSRVESSPSKEQSLTPSREEPSPSNYEARYNPFHRASDVNKSVGTQFDELKDNNHVSDSYGFKNEKPVSNYDSFFNSPTIHKNEVEGSTGSSPFERPKFPLSGHDLTYGHVQVP